MKSTTAWGQQAARVAEDAQLQREAQLVAVTPPDPDVLQVLVAQRVVAQQVRLALRKGKQGRPLPAGQDGSPCHALSLKRMRHVDWDTAYDTWKGSPEAARDVVSQTFVCDTC